MVAVTDAPCAPWEPTWCVDLDTIGADVLAVTGMALEAATDLLWTLTGRRYGTCEVTTRPCASDCFDNAPWGWMEWILPSSGDSWGWPWPTLVGGTWINLACGACNDTCTCGTLHQFELPYPVASITQIKIDGAVLPPSAYRIDDYRYVVRLDGEDWPRCNDLNLSDTEVGTWSVTAEYGTAVPPMGKFAVGELAIEIAKACVGNRDCKISVNVERVQRQGVTKVFIDPNNFRDSGLTGLYMVDQFLNAKNPNRVMGRAKIFDIDGRRGRITGTG